MTPRRVAVLLCALGLVASGCSVGKAEEVVTPGGGSSPIPATTSVTYCSPGGAPLSADLWLPENAKKPVPLVIFVHGGSWVGGTRSDGESLAGALPGLVQRGIAFASIDYRLYRPSMPTTVADIVTDVACAVEFFQTNASRWNLAPDRVGLLGESAGAHMSALVALDDYLDPSHRPKAVATLSGPTDMTVENTLNTDIEVLKVFGAKSVHDPVTKQLSPVTWVSADAPPFLIVQGDADEGVDLAQAALLRDRLKASGVPVEYVPVHGAGHVYDSIAEDPAWPAIFQRVIDFFVKYLVRPQ